MNFQSIKIKMPPKIILGGGIKKLGSPIAEKKFGLPQILLPEAPPSFEKLGILEDERERLQKISSNQKSAFISNTEDLEEKMPMFSIIGVNFNILNKDILEKISVVDVSSKISRTEDYFVGCEQGKSNIRTGCSRVTEPLPPENSITSYTEMGVMRNDVLCPKCNKTNMDCPGHLGRITLNKHYIHPMFMEYAIWTLISVCNSCSKILVSEACMKQTGIDKMQGAPRLKAIAEVAKNCRCTNDKTTNCVPNPEYILKNIKDSYKIQYIISKKDKDSKNVKEIEDIEKILDSISDSDATLLGFGFGAHPRHMILKSFPVIPPCARPFTVREGQEKEDHLTTCYDEIIRDNFKYARTSADARLKGYESKKDEEGIEAHCKRRYERDLHFHISHFIDNSDGKYCRSPTEKIKGIKQRIVKKEGLIRQNIMGKRVNFCGRSVAGPDSDLKFGEVAIPEIMGKILTVPETVHEKNIDFIRDLWNQRKIVNFYFGKGEVRNRRIHLNEKTYNVYSPNIGDRVDRQLMDGDVVLLNRQPTLYKYSLVGNRVKLVDRKTIGLHMVETKMRQADFDGDELNIHVIQALDARVEAMSFANVHGIIQSALTVSSMIGIIYNSLSAVYMMTSPDRPVLLTEAEFAEGTSRLTNKEYLASLPERLKKHKINPLSGNALFSTMLPPDFYFNNGNIVIKDGVLLSGQVSAKEVGKKGGTIQGSIWKWYGQDKAVSFITDCTFVSDWFIFIYGLSIGYEDICPDYKTRKLIQDSIVNDMRVAQNNINMLGPETPSMTLLEKQTREKKIYRYCQDASTTTKVAAEKFLDKENPLSIMEKSGAKGNLSDILRFYSIIGQITVDSQRPKKKLSQGKRCLPYFEMDSEEITGRGFIQNSFLSGMTPSDMYFMAESSREGVSNTALTTADTGSMHHRLVKVMEDVKVDYDGSVRNARGTIYQFSYYDGYEVSELVRSKSKVTGDITSFINLNEAVERINTMYE